MPARSNLGRVVDVEGLAELRRELKHLGAEWPKELAKTNQEAAEMMAGKARASASAQGGVAAKSAPSIRASRRQSGAAIMIGSARYPFALGAEFGSIRYHQFKEWRGNQWDDGPGLGVGYFLYPTIRDNEAEFIEFYANAIDSLTALAFPS